MTIQTIMHIVTGLISEWTIQTEFRITSKPASM